MTYKRIFRLMDSSVRERAAQECWNAPDGAVVRFSEATRSLDQNALLWKLLTEVSEQVVWYGRKLDPESWKHIFTSSLKRMDVVPNLDGTGFVALGLSTSRMTKREFSELIELIHAFCAERGVTLSTEVAA